MIYPETGEAEARSKFRDYMQSTDAIYSYYLSWAGVGVYFENESGDDYYRFEAPYDQVGEILAKPLTDALELED